MNDEHQRVSLITGGTEGIGRAVALAIAQRGGERDRILLTGRDRARGEAVLGELRAIRPRGDHAFLAADLSLLADTQRLTTEIERTVGGRLDAVVCCAGILSCLPEWTTEGHERTFVLNYLSRYLLVRRLTRSLTLAPSGRVVLVANAGVYPDRIDLGDLSYRRGKPGLEVSARSQVANDLFALELARRLRGTTVEVTCLYPGIVRTRVFDNARGLPWFFRVLGPIVRLFAQTAEAAAETPAFLASAPEATGVSGRFYGPRRARRPIPRHLRQERCRQLWLASEALVESYLEKSCGIGPTSRLVDRAMNVSPLDTRSSTIV